MADNTELIGGVGVTLTADLSDLSAAFTQAQTDAQTAGTAIADAFSSGAAGFDSFDAAVQEATTSAAGLSNTADESGAALEEAATQAVAAASDVAGFGDAAEQAGSASASAASDIGDMGDAVEGAGSSAAGAANDVGELGDASEQAGSAAQGAESSLSGMAEQMIALGEALVIAEGLKDFATDALTASDNVARADIALTKLTGDGQAAQATLEALDQLGVSDGLSMPSLLQAATRMTAMLPAGTNVASLLGNIADGAAIMGTDITAAATKFDLMATAGTASGRTLTQLGLSLQSLAVAFNQVIPGADATSTSVAAMFKALGDPDERIAVLTAALSKMGGTAQTVATETFGGAWNSLVAQWDQLMVGAGNALEPVVVGLLGLVKTDVLPFLQSLVDDFRALPVPLQSATVAVGLVGAGLTVLGLAASAVGLAVTPLAGLLDTLGASSLFAAASEGTAATATEALGAASATSATEVGAASTAAMGLGGVLAGVLIVGIAAAVAGFSDLNASIKAAESSSTATQGAFNTFMQTMVTTAKTSADVEAAQDKVNSALDAGVISLQQATTWTSQLTAEAKKLVGSGWAEYTQQAGISLNIVGAATGPVAVAISNLVSDVNKQNTAVTTAKAVLDAMTTSLQTQTTYDGKLIATQQDVTAAEVAYQKALTAASEGVKTQTGLIPELASAADVSASATEALADKQVTLASNTYLAGQQLAAAQKAVDNLAIKYGLAGTDLQNYAGMYPKLATALDTANTALTKYNAALKASSDADQQVANQAVQTASSLDIQEAQVLFLDASYLQFMGGSALMVQVLLEQADQLYQTGTALGNLKVQVVGMPTSLTALAGALDQAKTHLSDMATGVQNGTNTWHDYQKALDAVNKDQEAYDEAAAGMAADSSGATDKISLLTAALAAAQAKKQDLDNQIAAGQPVWNQALAADNAVAAAQKALNDAMAASAGPFNTAQVGANGLVGSTANLNTQLTATPGKAAAAVSAINNIGTAASAASTSVDQLSAALDAATTGFANLASVSAPSGSQTVAPGEISAAPGSPLYTSWSIGNVNTGTLGGGPAVGWSAYYLAQAQAGAYSSAEIAALIKGGNIPNGSYPLRGGGTYSASTTSAGSTSTSSGVSSGAPNPLLSEIGGPTPVAVGATTTTTAATATGAAGATLIDEASDGTLYNQIDQIITVLTGSTFTNLTSATNNLTTATTANTSATDAGTTATDTAATASAAVSTAIGATTTSLETAGSAISQLQTSIQTLASSVSNNLKNAVGTTTTLPSGTAPVGTLPTGTSAPAQTAIGTTYNLSSGGVATPNTMSVTMHFENATFGAGITATQVAQAVTPQVMQGVTQLFRSMGARF